MLLEWLKALLYGIVEGVTEWLPISSTGHLILLSEWVPFRFPGNEAFADAFREMFDVIIQLGAILAVAVLYRERLFPVRRRNSPEERRRALRLWEKVLFACLPAAFVGVIGDALLERFTGRDLDGWIYNAWVVSLALIVYGVAFLIIERCNKKRVPAFSNAGEIPWRTAFLIGCFQVLALVPGTSRSGSTVLGGLLLGVSRGAAAEFSFFLALPVMAGAGCVKAVGFLGFLRESGVVVPPGAWVVLAVGCAVSFLVSMVSIRFLTGFVRKHSFAAFGVYRILLGCAVLFHVWEVS